MKFIAALTGLLCFSVPVVAEERVEVRVEAPVVEVHHPHRRHHRLHHDGEVRPVAPGEVRREEHHEEHHDDDRR